jgi:hypothetical protein
LRSRLSSPNFKQFSKHKNTAGETAGRSREKAGRSREKAGRSREKAGRRLAEARKRLRVASRSKEYYRKDVQTLLSKT